MKLIKLFVFACLTICLFTITSGVTAQEVKANSDANYDYIIVNNGAVITKYSGSIKDVVIPNQLGGYNVTGIGTQAFDIFTQVIKVTIPPTVTFIDKSAFYFNNHLQEVVFISGDNLKRIGSSAFENCTKLKYINIPESVTYIEQYAFFRCTSMELGCFPSSLKRIGESAFANCTSLVNITFPSGLDFIDSYAFDYCYNLEYVQFRSIIPPALGENVFKACSKIIYFFIPSNANKYDYDMALRGQPFYDFNKLK